MNRSVLLLHRVPGGDAHYDWMIQRDGGGSLITFRVRVRIDRPVPEFAAERLADHRAAYLDYEGPLSGGRGEVARVASGVLSIRLDYPDSFECGGRLGEARGLFTGLRLEAERWMFRFQESDRQG